MSTSTATPSDAANRPQRKTRFDPQTFKAKTGYRVCQTAADFKTDLEKFREIDQSGEKKTVLFVGLMVLGGAILAAAFLCVIMESSAATMCALIGGPLFAVGLIGWSAIGYADLEDRRYELSAALVRLLSADMPANGLLNANMKLLPTSHGTNFVKKGKVGPWKVKFYVDRWLDLSGSLLDGTKFSVAMIEKQQDRSKTKRSRSGKHKTKYKTKSSSEAIVRLKLKAKRHPDTTQYADQIAKQIRLPDWTVLKSIDVQGNTVTLRATTTVAWSFRGGKDDHVNDKAVDYDAVEWIAMMFLSLYQALNQNGKQ